MADDQHQRDQMASAQRDHESETWRDLFHEESHRLWAVANGWTPPAADAPEPKEGTAEDTETICLEIVRILSMPKKRSFNLLNCVAGYAMRCEEDGRSFQRLIDRTKSLEVKSGFIPDRRATVDAPEGPSVEQLAAILCRGYSHTLRGLRAPAKVKADLPCQRCLLWARQVRNELDRLDAQP